MSYQPEERYWTDYLRIALPVVGLLLMLGLFWFWATSLIGDEDDDDPGNIASLATATVGAVAPTPSPTPAPGVAVDVTEPAGGAETETATGTGAETEAAVADGADSTDTTAGDGSDAAGTDGEDPTEESEACDLDFCPGETVTTNSDDVNFRDDASTESGVIEQLAEGTELLVRDEDPVEEGDNTFIPVENLDGAEGWVAATFLDPES